MSVYVQDGNGGIYELTEAKFRRMLRVIKIGLRDVHVSEYGKRLSPVYNMLELLSAPENNR